MERLLTLLALAAVLLGSLLPIAASAKSAPAAVDAVSGAALAQWECSAGNVCFWNGFNGTGSRCMWDIADPDWASGSIRCSWALTSNVKSVWNRGTDSRFTGVVYYRYTNYNDRIGCTRQGQGGNLAGTYKLRSHQWTTGNCG
jgi:hypothetical protein